MICSEVEKIGCIICGESEREREDMFCGEREREVVRYVVKEREKNR